MIRINYRAFCFRITGDVLRAGSMDRD